jgi:hypothetical protein
MTRSYCTLFDAGYLSRGMALYRSLQRWARPFRLHVLCMDEIVERALSPFVGDEMALVPHRDFASERMQRIRGERSRAEYCWTCTPVLIDHLFERSPELPLLTYLDADLYFFASPESLFDEMGAASSLITPHFYSPQYDNSATAGRYCVQFMPFRNDPKGREVLSWWRDACQDWCFYREEDGKLGDQKYLDDWLARYPGGVIETKQRGAGVAPWNSDQYRFEKSGARVIGSGKGGGEPFPAIFYHFHALKVFSNDRVVPSGSRYHLGRDAIDLFYRPYLAALRDAENDLQAHGFTADPHGRSPIGPRRPRWRRLAGALRRRLSRALIGNHNQEIALD